MQQKDIWIIILLWTLSSLGSAIGSSLIIITSAWTGHLGQGISCCCGASISSASSASPMLSHTCGTTDTHFSTMRRNTLKRGNVFIRQ